MRYFITALFIFGCIGLYAQDEACNQLPYAKVDTKAALKSDLTKLISDDLPSDLKKEGEYTSTIKMYVDCHGNIEKPTISKSNLIEKYQTWLLNIVEKTKWDAAILGEKKVTSTVVVTVYIKQGHVRVSA